MTIALTGPNSIKEVNCPCQFLFLLYVLAVVLCEIRIIRFFVIYHAMGKFLKSELYDLVYREPINRLRKIKTGRIDIEILYSRKRSAHFDPL